MGKVTTSVINNEISRSYKWEKKNEWKNLSRTKDQTFNVFDMLYDMEKHVGLLFSFKTKVNNREKVLPDVTNS